MDTTLYILLGIVVILLLFAWCRRCSSCPKDAKERYDGLPDPCVHMMETGFTEDAADACASYASKCKDTCEPYPIATQMVANIYAKYGVGPGKPPTADVDKKVVDELNSAQCLTGLGPGNPCTPGEEDCYSPLVCGQQGKCVCPSDNVYTF